MARCKVRPCLWFDGQAEEAARFYAGIFPDSEVTRVAPGPDGRALVVEFRLGGREILGLNGGPHFRFNEAISLTIDCADQAEVDHYWDALSDGGEEGRCGWLKDRYGLSWQVVPAILPELMAGGDPEQAGRVMAAMMTMTRLDVAALREAAVGA